MPKPKKPKNQGATVDDIFDMLTDRERNLPGNVGIFDGKLNGSKVAFVCAEVAKGDPVPIALILDERTRSLLQGLEEIAAEDRHGPGDDEDDLDDEGEDDEDVEDFIP